MPEIIGAAIVGGDEISLVLSDHVLSYLTKPPSSSKTIGKDILIAKMNEAVPQIHDLYQRQKAAMSGVICSSSTSLNIVFAYKRIKLHKYEMKAVTIEVKSLFEPRNKKDYLIKVSKKKKMFKNQWAAEIGPDIYALTTSFENGDPYGLIIGSLVEDLAARRKEFAPNFYGSFEATDGAIYCVAAVDRGGSILVDSAFWQPYGDFQTVKVK